MCWRMRTPLPRRKTVKGPRLSLSPRFQFGVTYRQLSKWQMLCCPQLSCLPAAIKGELWVTLRALGLGKHLSWWGELRSRGWGKVSHGDPSEWGAEPAVAAGQDLLVLPVSQVGKRLLAAFPLTM